MILARYFARRADGRCAPPPDVEQIERDLDARLALRKAARAIASPGKRGWATRAINRGAV